MRDRTLLVVKSGRPLQELLAEWPENVEFIAHDKRGAVTVGWVRVRHAAPTEAIARRD